VAHGKQRIRQYYLEYTIRSGVIVNINSKRLFNPRLGAVQYRHRDMYIIFNRFRGSGADRAGTRLYIDVFFKRSQVQLTPKAK
jgi:hypothetical protein